MKEVKEKNFEICGAKTKKDGSPCQKPAGWGTNHQGIGKCKLHGCLLYTSPSPRDRQKSRMPSSA